jgi:hypothetical protein
LGGALGYTTTHVTNLGKGLDAGTHCGEILAVLAFEDAVSGEFESLAAPFAGIGCRHKGEESERSNEFHGMCSKCGNCLAISRNVERFFQWQIFVVLFDAAVELFQWWNYFWKASFSDC